MSQYSTLYPTNDVQSYTSGSPNTEYVDSNVITTLGPVYTPKVYASELDVLEIASSGKVAVTLLDEHAFDIVDNTSNVIFFTARDNNSFKFQTEAGTESLSLGPDGDVEIAGGRDIVMTATEDVDVNALVDFRIDAANDGSVAASNDLLLDAKSEMTVSASNDLTLRSVNAGLDVDAGTSIDMDAGSTLSATAVTTATFESTSADVDINAATALTADAGTTMDLTAQQTATLSSTAADTQVLGATDLTLSSGSTTTLRSTDGDVVVNASGTLDADAYAIDMDAGDTLTATAGGAATLESTASSVAVAAATTLDMDANDLDIDVVAATTLDTATLTMASTGTTTMTAGDDFSVTATGGTVAISSDETASLGGATGATLESSAGPVAVTAQTDLTLTAVTETATLESSGSNVQITAATQLQTDSATAVVNTTGTTDINSTGDLTMDSAADMSLSASNDLTIDAKNELVLYGDNNATLESANSNVVIAASNGDVTLYSDTGVIRIDGALELTGGLSGVSSLTSSADVDITSGSNVLIDAALGIAGVGSNTVDFDALTGAMTLSSRDSNVEIDAGDDIYITANKNVFVTGTTENIELTADDDLVMTTTTGSATLTAATLLDMNAADLDIDVTSATTLDSASVAVASTGATTLTAGGTMSLTSTDDLGLTSSGGDATLSAPTGLSSVIGNRSGGNVIAAKLESTGAGNFAQIKVPDDGKQVFSVGNYDVIEVYKTEFYDPADSNNLTDYKIKINGDFEILGAVNSIGVTQTELEIEDKLIHLAFNSNVDLPNDGIGNDGAGVRVDGFPAAADSEIKATNPERYEKSITWHNGTNGLLDLGKKDAFATESYWNVQGGAMRWSHVDETTGDEVSFIMRINEREEFEMVKRSKPFGGAETFTKVAKFGRVLPL